MIVIGEKEEEGNSISLRSRKNGDEGSKNLDEFIKDIKAEINDKTINL